MKCSEIIELGQYCSISDALKPCEFYDEETCDCLKHRRELQELNKRYGCLKVFVKNPKVGEVKGAPP